MTRLSKLVLLALTLLLCCIAGCDTKNVNPWNNWHPRHPDVKSVLIQADAWNAGEIASITVYWYGNYGPFDYWITGIGEPLTGTVDTTAPIMRAFKLTEGDYFRGRVTITNAKGTDNFYDGDWEAEFNFGPVGPTLNDDPEIVSAVFDDATGQLTVSVTDTEGDDVTVTVTDVAGLAVDADTVTVAGGNGDAVFNWCAVVAMAGGEGITTVGAADAWTRSGDEANETVTITVEAVEFSPMVGRLGAIPMASSAAVGETVTVLVATGDFPSTAAFNYMNGVGVTVTDGGDYVDDTFNVGSLGGAIKDVDGIWADMAPAPNTFFVPENFMMKATDVTADGSLDFMGFNITPIGAGEVTGGGDLFNFGIAFDHAGTYELGFIEFQDVKRTYYSDNAGVEHSWDLTPPAFGMPPSVTVN